MSQDITYELTVMVPSLKMTMLLHTYAAVVMMSVWNRGGWGGGVRWVAAPYDILLFLCLSAHKLVMYDDNDDDNTSTPF